MEDLERKYSYVAVTVTILSTIFIVALSLSYAIITGQAVRNPVAEDNIETLKSILQFFKIILSLVCVTIIIIIARSRFVKERSPADVHTQPSTNIMSPIQSIDLNNEIQEIIETRKRIAQLNEELKRS